MDNEMITNLYEDYSHDQSNNSPEEQLESWWSSWAFSCRDNIVSGFLVPHLLTLGTNYKCKLCQNKICDKYKISTREPYSPIYHVHCYKQLHDQMIIRLQQFTIGEIEKIPDDEKPALTNVTNDEYR
jgi:hypothetical protein